MTRYLTLNSYNGALGGIQPNPAGPNDTPSPGGLSSIDHHWTHGLFGWPEQVTDAYAGTGDRYIYGQYGNMYTPNAHTDLYTDYHGPHTDRTEYRDLHGDPYFWNEGPATNKGQELIHHSRYSNLIGDNKVNPNHNMIASQGHPIVPREGVGFVSSNIEMGRATNNAIIEHYTPTQQAANVETSIEFIDDPLPSPKPVVKPQAKSSASSAPKTNSPPKTCNKPPSRPIEPSRQTQPPNNSHITTNVETDKKKKSSVITMLVLIGVLVCIDLWGEFTHVFIAQYLNKGKDVTYVRYAIYALVATICVIVAIQYTGTEVPVCVSSTE
jgi:hypothetical protein